MSQKEQQPRLSPGFDIAYLPITSSMNGEIQGQNVRHIVRCVNSHEALVAALKAILNAASINGTYSIPATKGRALLLDRGEEAQARAALAAAESTEEI